MAFMPYREWARRLGASPPKRICCFMVRVPRGSNRIQGCGASFAPNWRALLGSSPSVSTLSARPHWSDLTGESPYKRLPYDDILDHCCHAWNKLVDQPWTIMSIGLRDWAHRS